MQKTPARNSEETKPMDSARGAGSSSKEIQAGQYYSSIVFFFGYTTAGSLLLFFFLLRKLHSVLKVVRDVFNSHQSK